MSSFSLFAGGGEWRGVPRCSRHGECGNAGDGDAGNAGNGWLRLQSFPLKQAATSGSLALSGDTIAQLRERWGGRRRRRRGEWVMEHDWVRSLRMFSYGFLFYGPGSHAWYQLLDKALPLKNAINLSIKVALNQLVLGPAVIAVVFAWNSIWLGKLSDLPSQYRQKAIPTLLDGWKFWTPATVLNFSVVPLDARVAYMSCCSVFWNFYLSTAMKR